MPIDQNTPFTSYNRSIKERGVSIMKDTLELVFIIDQSGSMRGLEKDTIGGFNSILDKQKDKHGSDVIVSTVLFSHKTDVIHNRIPIEEIEPLDERQYVVGGTTALLDAVGGAIDHITRVHNLLGVKNTPNQTLFVITTDGQENASRYFKKEMIEHMIKQKQEEGWEFIFLGANIDAYNQARSYGIRNDRVSNYMHDSEGVKNMYESLNEAVHDLRTAKMMKETWKQKVEADYLHRGKYISKNK